MIPASQVPVEVRLPICNDKVGLFLTALVFVGSVGTRLGGRFQAQPTRMPTTRRIEKLGWFNPAGNSD